MKKIIFLLLCIVSFSGFTQTVMNVNVKQFKNMIDSIKGTIIDLRTNEEIRTKGKIVGAQQIDFLGKDAEKLIAKLDKAKTYFIYCAGGGRSGECAELMQKSGFKKIINLELGYGEWKTKGYPIEQVK
ncbi:MAG: rhodanese-like domain-containing protein [Bacteroidetes bacterium]|nr:rhodanese-like domain-containing protein [Bacteroidota bacterium]